MTFRIFVRSIVLGSLLLVTRVVSSAAQQGTPPPRERVHPEMVDRLWGPRVAAAWQAAFARHDADARHAFEALHRDQPQAVEPMLGLGFVARATNDRVAARRWFRAALEVEPNSESAREQLTAMEWDRPTYVAASGGSARSSGKSTGTWAAGGNVWIDPIWSLNAGIGQVGAGDPIRGIFLDSANGGGANATYVSAGVVARPVARTTLSALATRWISHDQRDDYLYLEAARLITPTITGRIGARPISGVGAPQVSAGIDAAVAPAQIATLEFVQGTRGAPFEARSTIRGYYNYAPRAELLRLGLIREFGPANSATTAVASFTHYFQPRFGVIVGGTDRWGAFARTSFELGAVYRP